SMDTRIYSTQVDLVSQWSNWYGTAHRADLLRGGSSLAGSAGELEGTWNVIQGSYGRTGMGTFAQADQNLALMASDIPCGLVHVQVITSAAIAPIALLWRVQDSDNFWSFAIDHQGSQLKIKENGLWQTVAVQEQVYLSPDTSHSLQILDDGQTFQLSCNGQRAFCFTDPRLQDQAGLGLFTSQAHPQQHFYGFEAHPRQVLLPPALRLKAPWGLNLLNRQTSPDITEDFGGASQELTGKSSTTGGQIWHKLMGKGAIRLTGEGSARVHGSWQQPHEGRTAYGVDWYHPEFADVQVQITPPELYQGQKTEGRGGLIFWQDRDNFLAISTWVSNIHPGSAVSCFFCFAGYEDLYSAVWTDTGDRILWGVPHLFRVCFDGMNYQGFVNDEPVIYRALTDVFPQIEPLIIRRVGIVANWEWGGGDMGSRFDHFRAQPY
ncbi:MAG: nucleotide-binding protein, partial [Oscillatoriales cyanobacterium SM2_3_0]|nr:nucleotide-binding protein [Oscillatoriales cyanobacterium SM2_3_0]